MVERYEKIFYWFLVSAPSLIYTITSTFSGAIWRLVNTIIVGAIIGYGIEKISKNIIRN